MNDTFGSAYTSSVASDQTLSQLDDHTVNSALAAGWEPRDIWIAVCQAYPDRVPSRIQR